MNRLRWTLSAWLSRGRMEREMREELADHLRLRVEDLVRSGMVRRDAELQARREFGSVALSQEDCRESWQWMDGLARNLRIALRQLRRDVGFTATAIVILALCIGANAAMFSLVDAALFRPLPYPEPERLALLTRQVKTATRGFEGDSLDGASWEYLRDHTQKIEVAVTASTMGVNLALSDTKATYVQQHRVSTGYFRVLAILPMMGREFNAVEDRPGGPPVAMVSAALWRRDFASDPQIIGRSIRLRGEPHTVVGVMPATFTPVPPADVWTPLRPSTKGEGSGANYAIFARIRPGNTWEQASAELKVISPGYWEKAHLSPGVTAQFKMQPVQTARAMDFRRPALLLWAAVGLVLLIGCVNIAGLLLARGGARAHDIATRLALGSSRASVAGQLLTENLLVALAGGVAGLALAYGCIAWIGESVPKILGVGQVPQIDWRVIAAALAATIATVLVFGLYPAWSLSRLDVRSALASSGRTMSMRRGRMRNALLVAEVALSVVLLAGAGLVGRTLSYLTHLDPGFDGTNVMTASLSLQDARYATGPTVDRLFDATLSKLRAEPGIEHAGVMLTLPYERALNSQFKIQDGLHASDTGFTSNAVYVTPGVFEALRMRLLKGRLFDEHDRRGAPDVVIVNEAFSRRNFKDDEPLGRHVSGAQIVGVVADTQQVAGWDNFGPVGRVPAVYMPAAQTATSLFALVHNWFSPKWVVRTRGEQPNLARTMQNALANVDPLLPFAEFRGMREVQSFAFRTQRAETALLGVLAGLALVLVSVGIYGLIAQLVNERRLEFGIRLALGAPVARVIRGAARHGLTLSIAGVAIGSGLALAAGKYVQAMLWGVQSNDAFVFASVALLLVGAAALASFLPSMRIARINPSQTLRGD